MEPIVWIAPHNVNTMRQSILNIQADAVRCPPTRYVEGKFLFTGYDFVVVS